MTLLGKILTVLIFAMSFLFMAFAITVYATHTNWRTEVMKLQKNVQAKQRESDQLRREYEVSKDALAREQAARRYAIATLWSKYNQISQQIQQRERSLNDLQAANGILNQTHQTTVNELKRLTDAVTVLRKDILTAQQDRDATFAAVVKLTDDVHRLEGLKGDLQERRTQLLGQVSNLTAVLNAHGLTPHSDVANIPPAVDGVVTAVSQRDLVEISIGSDDGLKKGHTLDVYRRNEYLGRIVIRRTAPDRAVAEIMKEFKRGVIKKGDRVATKLI